MLSTEVAEIILGRYGRLVSKDPTTMKPTTRQRLRRWWPWVLLSAILHLPFTPVGPWLGLLSVLIHLRTDVPDEAPEELVGIPVELLAAPAPAAELPQSPSSLQGETVVIAPPKPKPPRKALAEASDAGMPETKADAGLDAGTEDAGVADAGTADSGVTVADAGELDAGTVLSDAGATEDGGVLVGLGDAGTLGAEAGIGDAGAASPDPFAMAGELGKFQKGNVNVQIHFYVDPLKRHPAGAVIADFLQREPQWREFLSPGGIDPLRDLSRIVIMGPQLVDSSQIGVFLEYSGETATIRRAVDALVQRSEGGRWDTKRKKPVAYVHAAGSERVIIMYPNRGLAIVPPKVAEPLIALSKFPTLGAPGSDDEVVRVLLKTPYRVRAFKRFGVEVPKSIALAKVSVKGMQNAGAEVALELDDESPEAAASHAPELERDLAKLTMGLFSLRLRAEGSVILGEARLSPLIVAGILREVQKRLPSNAVGQ